MLDTEDTAAPAADGTPADADGREVGTEDAAGAWGVQAAYTGLVGEELASRRFVVESSEACHVLRERGRPQSGRQIPTCPCTVALWSKYTKALTFENIFLQQLSAMVDACGDPFAAAWTGAESWRCMRRERGKY